MGHPDILSFGCKLAHLAGASMREVLPRPGPGHIVNQTNNLDNLEQVNKCQQNRLKFSESQSE
jgi:hypothetical protein